MIHLCVCILEATSNKTAAVRPPTSQKPFKLDEQDMWDTARELRTNS